MPDYSLGKIYKVTCSQTNRIYIGSTTQKLERRFKMHKREKNECRTKDFIDPTIELIKDFPCETLEELLWEERRVMAQYECVNYRRAIVTKEEQKKERKEYNKVWREENKETIKEKSAQWREANKEYKNAKDREWREANKDEINARRKKRRAANKDEINAKRREKYHANKDEINAKRREKRQNSL